jgi:hypothetical protein
MDRQFRSLIHNVYQVGAGKDFIVFNDGDLSMEPLEDGDCAPCCVVENADFIQSLKSAAWSCNIQWYFIVHDGGIMLLNVYTDKGFACRQQSARFIEMFIETHFPKRRKRG